MKKNTVIVDIDGCLNHYPDPLKMWAEMLLNLDQPESKRAINEKTDLTLLKKTYRQSQILHHLMPRKGAKEVLSKIKRNNYLITILTSRNPNKNPKVKSLTINWLKKYQIPFDSIIFTKNKGAYVRRHQDQIIMVVEDEPTFLNSFKKMKIEIIAVKNDLNQNINKNSHFHLVSSWEEIGKLFESLTAI